MNKQLRKRHRQAWYLIALMLPIGIIFSWLVIPNSVPVKTINLTSPELLPMIKYARNKNGYCVNIRTNKENTQWQVEWKNILALSVPSAVVYKTSPEFNSQTSPGGAVSEAATSGFIPANSQLIGRIEARGNYVFHLNPDTTEGKKLQLTLYDFIHQQIIDTINFQP
ncbi:MAG: hypothetical protein ACSLE0_04315 [Chitinophagaceae bacterium]